MSEFKVLIIEDDEDISELILNSLKSISGMRILATVSNNAEEGFDLLYLHQYDLIITDYKLPGLDGLELIEGLRGHPDYRTTPVIFISGFFKELNFFPKDEKHDHIVFISKPFDMDRLVRNVKFFLLCNAA